MAALLEASDIAKNGILHGISLQVSEGEMVAVMGPSGSGKSTLLYQLSGMDTPDGGQVVLDGQQLTRLKENELADLRLSMMGFVFQQMNMIKNLSILDNVALPATYLASGKPQKQAAANKAQTLLNTMGIGELSGRKITEVSGGQLQRACICRSMINNPRILFADEPTGALNQSAAADVIEQLSRLNEQGMTIFMVTHDSKVASRCSRILYLLDGAIQGEFTPTGTPAQRERAVVSWLQSMGW